MPALSQLPPALAPWSEQLALFPPETGLALAPLLRRVESVLGAQHPRRRAGGEPDGFDGATGRGHYERLLLSEWLLAEEEPLEFWRRASQNEHLFLRVAQRQPAQASVCLAVFDAGPNQIGAPRLAQLAALIVLARRAQESGARFRWTTAPLGGEWHEGLSAASVRAFLKARESREMGAEALGAALESELTPQKPENLALNLALWLVGGQNWANWNHWPGAALLEIIEPLESPLENLKIVVHEANRPPREAILPLPAPRSCARLLRDPFEQAVAELKHLASGQMTQNVPALGNGLVFAFESQKLLARRDERSFRSYPLPNSPAEKPGKPRVFTLREPGIVAALGRVRKSTVAVVLSSDGSQFTVQAFGKGLAWASKPITFASPLDFADFLPQIEARAPGPVCALPGHDEAIVALVGPHLMQFHGEKVAPRQLNTLALLPHPSRSLLLTVAQNSSAIHGLAWNVAQEAAQLFGPVRHRAFLKAGNFISPQENVPLEHVACFWDGAHLRWKGEITTLETKALVDDLLLWKGEPVPLCRSADGRGVWVFRDGALHQLFSTSTPVCETAANASGTLIAYRSADELGVWSLVFGKHLMRLMASGEEAPQT